MANNGADSRSSGRACLGARHFLWFVEPDNVEDYLRQLVDDLDRVMDQGVTINKTKIGIDLRVIIADSPARAFIKGM